MPDASTQGSTSAGRGVLSQSFLSLADQGVSSFANMAATVAAASALGNHEFGVFSVAFILYSMLIAGAQSIFGNELVLVNGTNEERLERGREAAYFCVIIGFVVGAILIISGIALPAVRGPLFVLGIGLPFLFLQDILRFVCSILHKMGLALFGDLSWLILEIFAIALLEVRQGSASPMLYTLAWVVPGSIAGLLILPTFWRGQVPSLSRFRTRHYLGYRFIWEFVALRATSQGLILALGVLASLSATGAVRGATTLFGPLTVALLAAGSFGAPLLRRTRPELRDNAVIGLGIVLALSAAVVLLIFLCTPASLGHRILGATWDGSRTMLWPIGVQNACTALSTAAYLALRLVSPRSTLGLRIASMLVLVPAFFVGYAAWGVIGAVWSLTVGAGVQTILGVISYARLRKSGAGLAQLDDLVVVERPRVGRHRASKQGWASRTRRR